MDCVFCSILAGELPASLVYQDEIAYAFLDIQPINPGHTLVIPREHAGGLRNLPAETAGHLMRAAQKVAAGLYRSELSPSGVNLLLADGVSAGQDVFHAHLHVIPRHEGDGFGFTYPDGYRRRPAREQLDEIAGLLAQSIGAA